MGIIEEGVGGRRFYSHCADYEIGIIDRNRHAVIFYSTRWKIPEIGLGAEKSYLVADFVVKELQFCGFPWLSGR